MHCPGRPPEVRYEVRKWHWFPITLWKFAICLQKVAVAKPHFAIVDLTKPRLSIFMSLLQLLRNIFWLLTLPAALITNNVLCWFCVPCAVFALNICIAILHYSIHVGCSDITKFNSVIGSHVVGQVYMYCNNRKITCNCLLLARCRWQWYSWQI